MAVVPTWGTAPITSSHPARRLDLITNGSGFHRYVEANREHRGKNAPYMGEAADLLWKNLKNVPGDQARSYLLGADHRIALRKMCNHLRTAQAYDEMSARHIAASWSVFVGLYGDPGAARRKTGKIDPTK